MASYLQSGLCQTDATLSEITDMELGIGGPCAMTTAKLLRSQDGFTFIELLVVTSVIGILAASSLQSYMEYLDNGYRARARIAMSDVRTSMEGAHVGQENVSAELSTSTNQPGLVTAGDGATLLPGFVNSKDLQLTASFSGPCDSGLAGDTCLLESATVHVCKVGYQLVFLRYKDGVSVDSESQGAPWC